ncbi:transmembrane protein 187 [Erpetoichthys calabaricus]|uniref:transmembrane protein 187 n=1 Tax=Erpetoichthys calabaricus TaxID=27687 RepID=UPI002234A24E|nr:transmembrane protein 187 [Erpetoichthys calabaricus]
MAEAFLHVVAAAGICATVAVSGALDAVLVELGYEHYAEKPYHHLPAFIAMPFNSLVNLGYLVLGARWLLRTDLGSTQAAYLKDVFAWMALVYGPVQWLRLATQARWAAVLDQWFTLPIFAWVPVWCDFIGHGWRPWYMIGVEVTSLGSFLLSLLHARGFEASLICHIAFAIAQGIRAQRLIGDSTSRRYLWLAMLSCAGFVFLKLLDHELANFWTFRHLTGHFWSKVCDVLQFHFSFCFLTHLTRRRTPRKARSE